MASFWQEKKVFITGHTGFKGSWLSLWLQGLGAKLVGYSLSPPTDPSLYDLAGVGDGMISILGDIRDRHALASAIQKHQPEIIFHMAAQSLVRKSYQDPVGTIETNVVGTANLLDAVRHVNSVRVVVNVTSDKCYENKEWPWGYRESEPMGGYDPYSSSKGCAELITAAFRNSFFNRQNTDRRGVAIATARAGNVIGGGDWAQDRLISDIARSIIDHRPAAIRNPNAIRPWQHVLEPLSGYLLLAERLWHDGRKFSEAWNFGPPDNDAISVGELTQLFTAIWGDGAGWVYDDGDHPHEADFLKLDCSKARLRLGWKPRLKLTDAIEWTVEWYRAYAKGLDVRDLVFDQIAKFDQLCER